MHTHLLPTHSSIQHDKKEHSFAELHGGGERAHRAAACQGRAEQQQLGEFLVLDNAGRSPGWSYPALSPAVVNIEGIDREKSSWTRRHVLVAIAPSSTCSIRRRPRAQRVRWGAAHCTTGARARRRTCHAPGRHRLFFRAAVRRRSSCASVLAAGPGRKRAVWGGGEVEQGHRAGGAAGPGSTRGRRRGLGGGGWIGARGKSRALLVEEDTAAVAGARGNGSRRNSWWGRCLWGKP
jgi:hypothetical protein